jgi:hypothetical protein
LNGSPVVYPPPPAAAGSHGSPKQTDGGRADDGDLSLKEPVNDGQGEGRAEQRVEKDKRPASTVVASVLDAKEEPVEVVAQPENGV